MENRHEQRHNLEKHSACLNAAFCDNDLWKTRYELTFITSASLSSIFVESGSSLCRLTSNRSVLAVSSGCFTSTAMIQASRSTVRFAVNFTQNLGCEAHESRILDQSTVRRPKTGPDSLTRNSIFLHIFHALYLFSKDQSEARVNRPERSTPLLPMELEDAIYWSPREREFARNSKQFPVELIVLFFSVEIQSIGKN